MIKKSLLGVMLVGVVAVLVVGAVNRTLAKSEGPIALDLETDRLANGYARVVGNPHGAGRGRAGVEGVTQTDEGQASSSIRNGRPEGYFAEIETDCGAGQGYGIGGQGGGLARTADAIGVGQAEVKTWSTIEGVVVDLNDEMLVVETTEGESIEVTGRVWRFAQELGHVLRVGDRIRMAGFYDDGEFEVGQITNVQNGATVVLREQSGRPYWAGGRGGGG